MLQTLRSDNKVQMWISDLQKIQRAFIPPLSEKSPPCVLKFPSTTLCQFPHFQFNNVARVRVLVSPILGQEAERVQGRNGQEIKQQKDQGGHIILAFP